MKKFIKNILFFILIPSFIIFGSWLIYKQRIDTLKFKKNISILVCGDSHTECGINDSILKNAVNISNSSEHFLYTFNVLNHLLRNNQQIKTVILGCSFHSFDGYDNILFEGDRAQSMYARYFPILDFESMASIMHRNASGIFKSGINMYGKMAISIIKDSKFYEDYPFIGTYYKSDNSNLNDSTVITAIRRHYYQENGKLQEFSNYQKLYFSKIVELCIKNNVKLIIINTPISNNYLKRVPHKFILNYYSTISHLDNRISFWDFHSLDLENKFFGDGDHLNSNGAKILTLKIDSMMNLQNKVPNDNKDYIQ
ncbi:MAG: hypothetical protein ABIP30_10505 [Ferruginibacter sp.]